MKLPFFVPTVMKVLPPFFSALLSGHGVAFCEFPFSSPILSFCFALRVCVCGGAVGVVSICILTSTRLYLHCTSLALAR